MDRISEDNMTIQQFEHSSSVAQNLAPELLREIFLHCVSGEDRANDTDPYPQRSLRCVFEAPLLLGRVCSRWRSVSISSPELWVCFTVGDRDRSLCHLEKDLEATQYWMSKSGSRPLSILACYLLTEDQELLQPVLECLVSQSWRWENIKVMVSSHFKNIVLPLFRPGDLPRLVKFDYRIGGPVTDGSAEFVLSSAPRLQSLQYRGRKVHVDFGGRKEHNIKRIVITYDWDGRISLGDLLACFTRCPLLEELQIPICVREWEEGRHELPSAICAFHLTHLSLTWSPAIDPGHLFDRLFLPVLISLELAVAVDTPFSHTDWPHLQAMLANSLPPLRILRLRRLPIREVTLIGCLGLIPTLNSLNVQGVDFSDRFLHSLTIAEAVTHASQNQCPCLERIRLGWKCDFSERAMIEMIVSRMEKNTKNAGLGFASGRAPIAIKCPFAFGRIQSYPDIAACIKDGLVLVDGGYWQTDIV
ncbi:hypothetical protein BD410DRAFT_100020 [Rickenella mellea]|uniref:F-box domain-containing protein n=1 Tax=Rickenella mellea TaxID=50990 RepID=A0A4Y7PJW5_9AGAM|nr:hypothetical protein BD410DRAFT_100020 [Rickenella mellea]